MTNWLVVGLGNPGPTYAFTRHNVGFLAVDRLAADAGVPFLGATKMRAQLAQLSLLPAPGVPGHKLFLAKPTTFMNESGIAAGALAKYYKIPADHVIAIHDEIDLDPGRLRIKYGGGDNGHNGLKSLRAHLGTGDFYRVRVGVGRPPGRQDAAKWVLAKVTGEAAEELLVDAAHAADSVISLVTDGLTDTQNRFNS